MVKGMMQQGWDINNIYNYLIEAYTSGNVGAQNVLIFFDEILISDPERDPKRTVELTPEISAMFAPFGRKFIQEHEDEDEDEAIKFYKEHEDDEFQGFLSTHYTDNPTANPQPLVDMLQLKNKWRRTAAVKLLPNYPQARPAVEALLTAKRKDIREWAEKALGAMEQINTISLGVTNSSGTSTKEPDFDFADYVKKNKISKWDKVLDFTSTAHWPKVRKANSEDPAELEYLISYVGNYVANKDMQKMLFPEKMKPYFNQEDLKALSLQLFDEWIAANADNKSKGVMTLLGLHGDIEGIQKLKYYVPFFADRSRSAIAGDGIKAIAVSPTSVALVTIDNLGRSCSNKLVKRIADETLQAVADQLGLTADELGDKIVPNLGLDIKGEMTLDTGRTFTAKLKTDLNIVLENEEGKVLKSFPASTSKDDKEKYAIAKAKFTLLKKELKSLVATQAYRLQQGLSKGKKWTKETFEELFVQNPIMQFFSMSLVFGTYENDKLIHTFRYTGDGTYTNEEDDTFDLSATAEIRLIHPCELSVELKNKWLEQLNDYELKQPFLQLSRPIFDNADITTTAYEGFSGTWVRGSIGARLHKQGWERDPSGDGGTYYCMYYIGNEYSACLDLGEGICIAYPDESPTLGSVYFCKTEKVRISYRHNIHDVDMIAPKDLPKIFFSEIIYMLDQNVKATKEKDEEEE